jgi:hypothetical protein
VKRLRGGWTAAGVLAAVLLAHGAAEAQWREVWPPVGSEAPTPVAEERAEPVPEDGVQRSNLVLAGAGVLGGGVGLLAGSRIARSSDCERPPCDVGEVLAAAVGEVVGMSLGVHLANRRRGEWAMDVNAALFSGVIGAAVLSRILPEDTPNAAFWMGVPLVQVTATVAAERLTARENR